MEHVATARGQRGHNETHIAIEGDRIYTRELGKRKWKPTIFTADQLDSYLQKLRENFKWEVTLV